MTKTSNLIILGTALLISASIWIVNWSKPNSKNKKFTSKVFTTLNGWGYDILVNDSLFIHQESIPARKGKAGFREKKQAEQTARLIINKMKREELPAVTTFEIEQIIR